MSQLAGVLGGGGGASVNPSSSASAGPQAGTTGSLLLDFGGINLGNQDIPLSASTTSSSNAPPVVGNTVSAVTASTFDTYLPYILLLGAGIAFAWWIHKRL